MNSNIILSESLGVGALAPLDEPKGSNPRLYWKSFLFLFGLFVFAGCAPRHYIMVPDGVKEISICEIMNNSQRYLQREVVLEGKVLSLSSKGYFTLQCLHNPDFEIDIDQSRSVLKIETTGRKVKARGKLILKNDKMALLAEDVEIGPIVDYGSQSPESQQYRGGGGSCH